MKDYRPTMLMGGSETVQELRRIFTNRKDKITGLVRTVAAHGKAVLNVGNTEFNFECLQDISDLVNQIAEVTPEETICERQ